MRHSVVYLEVKFSDFLVKQQRHIALMKVKFGREQSFMCAILTTFSVFIGDSMPLLAFNLVEFNQ